MRASEIPVPEADFQRGIIELAHLQGWLVHHTRPARERGQWATPIQGDPGFPDLLLARGGRVIIAELKTEKAKPTTEQKQWLQHLTPALRDMEVKVTIRETALHFRCWSEVYLWRPSDWPYIERILKR